MLQTPVEFGVGKGYNSRNNLPRFFPSSDCVISGHQVLLDFMKGLVAATLMKAQRMISSRSSEAIAVHFTSTSLAKGDDGESRISFWKSQSPSILTSLRFWSCRMPSCMNRWKSGSNIGRIRTVIEFSGPGDFDARAAHFCSMPILAHPRNLCTSKVYIHVDVAP